MQINYSYESVPTIERFSNDDSFVRGIMGPFGSGKSAGCTVEIIRRAMAQEPDATGVRRTRWAIIRNTYKQLENTTIKTFEQWLPFNLCGRYYKAEHRFVCTCFPNVEFEVLFLALDRPEQIANLLSLELTGAWVNEARDVPKSIIDGLCGRVGRYPAKKDGGASWWGVFMDTNPPDDDSWWYKYFEENCPSNAKVFKQPSGLSPEAENIKNLPDNYYTNLAVGKDPDYIKVYIKGEYGYVKDGKPVYTDYSDFLHCNDDVVLPDPESGIKFFRGWDFGLTPACCFSFLAPNGQWVVFDEMTAESSGIDKFSDAVLQHCILEYPNIEWVDIGDPAGNQRVQTDERTCFDVLWGKNINIMGGDQDPNIRIESVRYALTRISDGVPCFKLTTKCSKLRKGFQGRYQYRRMQTAAERYVDKPDKNDYSHVHDALQYVATYLFADRLRGIKPYKEQLPIAAMTFDSIVEEQEYNKWN